MSRSNYISWNLDVELHLNAGNLGKTIEADNNESNDNRSKAMIFIWHSLDDSLKYEYLTIEDPHELWFSFKERFEHLKMVYLPKAHNDWVNLKFQTLKACKNKILSYLK